MMRIGSQDEINPLSSPGTLGLFLIGSLHCALTLLFLLYGWFVRKRLDMQVLRYKHLKYTEGVTALVLILVTYYELLWHAPVLVTTLALYSLPLGVALPHLLRCLEYAVLSNKQLRCYRKHLSCHLPFVCLAVVLCSYAVCLLSYYFLSVMVATKVSLIFLSVLDGLIWLGTAKLGSFIRWDFDYFQVSKELRLFSTLWLLYEIFSIVLVVLMLSIQLAALVLLEEFASLATLTGMVGVSFVWPLFRKQSAVEKLYSLSSLSSNNGSGAAMQSPSKARRFWPRARMGTSKGLNRVSGSRASSRVSPVSLGTPESQQSKRFWSQEAMKSVRTSLRFSQSCSRSTSYHVMREDTQQPSPTYSEGKHSAPPSRLVCTLRSKKGAEQLLDYAERAFCQENVLFPQQCLFFWDMEGYCGKDQYNMFRDISTKFVRPGSPYEVNISSAVRTKILKLAATEEAFLDSSWDCRASVLKAAFEEVEKMLWDNYRCATSGVATTLERPSSNLSFSSFGRSIIQKTVSLFCPGGIPEVEEGSLKNGPEQGGRHGSTSLVLKYKTQKVMPARSSFQS